jgi:hypothetical protein
MWAWLKRLGSDCWGNHDWISRSNSRGMWLECRHCGQESDGLELPAAGYRRTQEGADDAHRIGGVAPALRAAREPAAATWQARRFSERRAASWASGVKVARPLYGVAASAAVAADAERRWLQMFRALTPEERAVAERMVAGLSVSAPLSVRADGAQSGAVGTRRLVG